jgi:hypothetical protein
MQQPVVLEHNAGREHAFLDAPVQHRDAAVRPESNFVSCAWVCLRQVRFGFDDHARFASGRLRRLLTARFGIGRSSELYLASDHPAQPAQQQ